MTIQQLFDLGIEMAMKADPRGESLVKKRLAEVNEDYKKLPEKKKKFFDEENLTNPYSDSRIYVGDPKQKVTKVLAGIDVTSAEVLLYDRLNEKARSAGSGQGQFDLLITHHPEGIGYATLHEVMSLQTDMYGGVGVPLNVGDALMCKRMHEVEQKIHPINHNQAVDTARLLDVPLLSLHTVWDNLGNDFMLKFIKGKDYDTVGDIMDDLHEIPEFIEAAKGQSGPKIASGSAKSRVGKIAVFFTGGTNPSKEMYIELAKAGIGTIIDMHMPDDAIKEMKKHHVNVINTGHMASDSIGANIFFDELEKHGVEVVACSGYVRVKRKSTDAEAKADKGGKN